MRVVVTGASGNVGTALRRLLDDEDVIGLARRPAAGPWVAADLGTTPPAVLREVFTGADAVVHLAWAISPGADDPPMSRTNEAGTKAVLDAVAAAKVPRLVVASSIAAYRPAPRWTPVGEDWPLGGIAASAYSRSKVRLEQQLDEFAAVHPEVALARLRPCGIAQREAAGEFARWLFSPLLPLGVLGRVPLPLWSGLRLQLVHADDVAEAIRLILRREATGAFNLASPEVLDAGRLAELVGGRRVPVPRAVLEPAARLSWLSGLQPLHPGWLTLADQAPLADVSRAEKELSWSPRHTSAETLRELLDGWAEHAGNANPPLAPPPRGLRSRLTGLRPGRPLRQG
ncbi:NAD-dependent epimerase/dehydratase family protein [Amycolatopsis sp. 195334CR]|uniref:NAD-dependent epimerase/dehydratase family protein n=1 Tax=Amycolatopsis sp. 195334CR TaxID=2814588 RepID=UPI001A8C59C6|nr:NAD-dependent epimerase/dehydratase family protein [Amycolatopsis sp. 195334CR]MBN6039025.1 NAD-dependent epimerase/dehydratase family protein [Amycolatopsis sp. 195334CR]